MFKRHRVLLTAISFLTLTSFSQAQESHVRIVRVSYVEGSVQINNQSITTNTPLIEGNVLSSGVDSFAEIEFEDGNILRVGPNTRLTFSQLARLSSGEAVTRVDLDEGEMEVATNPRMHVDFAVGAGEKNVRVPRGSRIRIFSTKENPLELAVWAGEALVHDPESGQDVVVGKHETFILAADDPEQYDLEKGIEADALDQFSKLRDQYVARDYVSSNPSTSAVGVAGSGFVDPCQQYYWYPGIPQNCFSPFAFDPFLFYGYAPYGYGYVPGYYYRPHHHPPIIHPPTPATAARSGNAEPGRVSSVTARDGQPGTPRVRSFNDDNFKRSSTVQEEHETKVVANENSKSRSPDTPNDSAGSRHAQPARSTDLRHSSSSGSSSPSAHASGGGSHSSAPSYSGSSSHSSGFSSSGGGFHSSSSSASSSSSGSSGRSK